MSPELVEIGFKKTRKAYYINYHGLELEIGDLVIVEAEKGNDLGKVLQINSRQQLKDVKEEPKIIVRKARRRNWKS